MDTEGRMLSVAGDTGPVDATEQILKWAEGHVLDLSREMTWQEWSHASGGRWVAAGPEATDRIRARATSALAFLERYTGTDSRWTQNAHGVFNDLSTAQSMESGARAISDVISEWTRAVRSGQAQPRLVESLGARAVASTDLLEQVRALNADKNVIPGCPDRLGWSGPGNRAAIGRLRNSVSLPPTSRASAPTPKFSVVLMC